MVSDKRPRQYVSEILALPLDRRAAALEAVPETWRAWVKHYVGDHDWRRRQIHRLHLPPFCYDAQHRPVQAIVIHFFSCIYTDPKRWDDPNRCWELFHDLNLDPHGRRYRIYDGPRQGASAGYLVARNGVLYELAPRGVKTWHAGRSIMNGRADCNSFAEGIEIIAAPHVDATKYGYTEDQYISVSELCRRLMDRNGFGREWIKGHDEARSAWNAVYPDKAGSVKVDPGPSFDWDKLYRYIEAAA